MMGVLLCKTGLCGYFCVHSLNMDMVIVHRSVDLWFDFYVPHTTQRRCTKLLNYIIIVFFFIWILMSKSSLMLKLLHNGFIMVSLIHSIASFSREIDWFLFYVLSNVDIETVLSFLNWSISFLWIGKHEMNGVSRSCCCCCCFLIMVVNMQMKLYTLHWIEFSTVCTFSC